MCNSRIERGQNTESEQEQPQDVLHETLSIGKWSDQ